MPRSSPTLTVKHPVIKASGSALTPQVAASLLEMEVESTYNRPDLCLLTFDLDADTQIPAAFDLGAAVEVSFSPETGGAETVFSGEVTALEFEGSTQRSGYVVQCEDKFHRFFRSDRTHAFLNQKITDVARTMAGEHGVSSELADMSTVYEFLMQQNVSNGAWLLAEAAKRNCHVRVNDGKLLVQPVGAGTDSGLKLHWGSDLLTFSARATGNAFLKDALVTGWDTKKKEAIKGTASSFTARKDPQVATAPYSSSGTTTLVRTGDVVAKGDADAIAKAVLERANEHNLQAEGLCAGSAKFKIDAIVEITGVNARFDGAYRISHIRHRFTFVEGFLTEFSCRGASDQSIVGLVEEAAGSRNRADDRHIFDGAAVGIVSSTKDPDGLGRVKVKLPTLPPGVSGDLESDWMRVAFPGAGGKDKTHHGWYLIPEVGDEVLVIFEQGDTRRGYVLGGLHNSVDKPFYGKDKVVAGDGAVNYHAFRTKNGSHLLFDETQNAEKIELKNKDDQFTLTYVEKDGLKILEQANKKIVIDGKGNIEIISGSGDVTIEAKAGAINLKAATDIVLDAKANVKIKAATAASLEGGTTVEVKGAASAKLEASGQTTVKGAMVMIN